MADAPHFIADRTRIEKDDPFGVEPLVCRITTTLDAVPPPFAVSLSGAWGIGKTTVVEEVRERRGHRFTGLIDLWAEDISLLRWRIAVELEAMLNSRSDEELAEARKAAAKRLEEEARKATTTPSLTSRVGGFGKFVQDLGLKGFVFVLVTVVALFVLTAWTHDHYPGLAPALAALLGAVLTATVVAAGLVVSVDSTSTTMAPANERQSLMNEVLELLEREPGRQLVMIVDNIDRLTGDDALAVLGELRTFIDVDESNCVFFVPLDRGAFAKSVGPRLGSEDAARDFLEKFFGLDILLTRPASLDVRSWTRDLLRVEFGGRPTEEVDRAAEVIARAAQGSPRTTKRMVNDITARHHLLDKAARTNLTLQQLALVEAIVDRFPHAAERIADHPRRLTDARASLRERLGMPDRISALSGLLESGSMGESDARRATDLANALLDILVFADSIPMTATQVQTILSAREDRDWKDVVDADLIKAALDAGDGAAFEEAVAGLTAQQRADAINVALHVTRRDMDSGFHISALTAVGALARLPEPDHRDRARAIVLESLRHIDGNPLRTLPDDVVDLVFQPDAKDPRIDAFAKEAATTLQVTDSGPRAALVRTIHLASDRLTEELLTEARAALARGPVADLAVLFEPDLDAHLVDEAVAVAVIGDIANWTPDRDPDLVARECGWVETALDAAIAKPQALASVAEQIRSRVSTGDIDLGGLRPIILLLRRSAPAPETDALAVALASQTEPDPIALWLAVRIPLTPGQEAPVTASLATLLREGDAADIHRLVDDSDSEVRNLMDIATPLTQRWLDGADRDFLAMAVANHDERSWTPGALGITGASPSDLLRLMVDAAHVVVDPGTPKEGTDKVIAAITGRIADNTVPPTDLEDLGEVLSILDANGSDTSSLLSALATRVSTMQPGEGAAWTALAKEVVAKGPATEATLVSALVDRCLANGAIDLASAPWLVEHGADVAPVATAVAAEVRSRRHQATELANSLGSIRDDLEENAQVGMALVEAAATDPWSPDAPVLLEEASHWRKVTGRDSEAYDDLLTELAKNAELNPLIGKLRGRRPARRRRIETKE